MHIYGELTKIEPQPDGSIRLYGVASTGARDSAGEVVTPEAMRAALPDYLRFGAIREMHQPSAAGAALSAEVDPDGATRIAAHVVDPLAVTKVKAGVYKGLSIGGKVLARDAYDPTVITRIRLDEISLVDRPCNPEAVIDLWKSGAAAAGGGLESFTPDNAAVKARADALAKAAGKPGRRNDFVAQARDALIAEHLARSPVSALSLVIPEGAPAPIRDPAGPGAELGPGSPLRFGRDDSKEVAFADPLSASYPLDTEQRIRAAWAAVAAPQNRAVRNAEDLAAMESRIVAAWKVKIDPAGPPAAVIPDEPSGSIPDPGGQAEMMGPGSPPRDEARGSGRDDMERAAAADDLAKIAGLTAALAAAEAEVAALAKRLNDQTAELERLRREPLPPRTGGSRLAKVVTKEEDAGHAPADLDVARLLDLLPPAERTHLLMKAALARPIPVIR